MGCFTSLVVERRNVGLLSVARVQCHIRHALTGTTFVGIREPRTGVALAEGHVRRVCLELVECYNRERPSQATGAIPDPYPERLKPSAQGAGVIALPVLGGLQHDYRPAA